MKKLFFVFAIAMLVLFTVNLTLAEDNISILIKGIDGVRPLTDEECKKIGELIIPSSAKREVYKITTEELMLSPGIYLLFGEKEPKALCPKGTIFLNLPPGVYILYTAPFKPSMIGT